MKNKINISSKSITNFVGKWFAPIMRFVMLCAVGYLVIFPLVHMLTSAFKTLDAFKDPMIVWISPEWTLDSVRLALEALNFGKGLRSTLLYEMVSAILQVASCAIAAYGLARFKFKGKKILMALLLLMIIIPEQMIVLPSTVSYSQFDFFGIVTLINKMFGAEIRLNMLDTVFPFWAPSFFGVGLKAGILIYIYIQFFKGLPKELEEAAWIDGAGPYKTFFSIAIPSSTVVIFTVFVFSLIWHWNDYSYAAMYLNENYSLAVILSDIVNNLQQMGYYQSDNTMGIILAACLLFVLPMLIVYILIQKQFIKSIDRVGITG